MSIHHYPIKAEGGRHRKRIVLGTNKSAAAAVAPQFVSFQRQLQRRGRYPRGAVGWWEGPDEAAGSQGRLATSLP